MASIGLLEKLALGNAFFAQPRTRGAWSLCSRVAAHAAYALGTLRMSGPSTLPAFAALPAGKRSAEVLPPDAL